MTTDLPELTPIRTRAKICGITRIEDAKLAVDGGAWAVGMIMWKGSERYVEPQRAAEIVDVTARSAEAVGVFVDQPLDEVVGLTNELGLSIVQLHGNEGLRFCNAVAQRTGAKTIKAFRVQGRDVLGEMGRYYDVDYQLLDTWKAGVPGGTGETFDWDFLRGRRRGNVPLILSGGLDPENVISAIETVGPYAVDVSSGVEIAPGVKDPEKLAAFLAAVEASVSPRKQRREPAVTGAEEEVLTLKWAEREAKEAEFQRQLAKRLAEQEAERAERAAAEAESAESEVEAVEPEAEAVEATTEAEQESGR